MGFLWFVLLVVWIVLSVLVAKAAVEKGRNFGAFLAIGLLVSPVISFIAVAVIAPLPVQPSAPIIRESLGGLLIKKDNESLVKCPFCAEYIKTEAQICRFCGKDVEDYVAEIKEQDRLARARVQAIRHASELDQQRARVHAQNWLRQQEIDKAEQRRAFYTSKKFVFSAIGIVVGAATLAIFTAYQNNVNNAGVATVNMRTQAEQKRIDLLFSSGERSAKSQWQQIVRGCGFKESVLSGSFVNVPLESSTLENGTFYYSRVDCVIYNLVGGFTADQKRAKVKIVYPAGIQWTPEWNRGAVLEAQKTNYPFGVKFMKVVESCDPNAFSPRTTEDNQWQISVGVDWWQFAAAGHGEKAKSQFNCVGSKLAGQGGWSDVLNREAAADAKGGTYWLDHPAKVAGIGIANGTLIQPWSTLNSLSVEAK
jgi:large-conductance mechanosensitive channel